MKIGQTLCCVVICWALTVSAVPVSGMSRTWQQPESKPSAREPQPQPPAKELKPGPSAQEPKSPPAAKEPGTPPAAQEPKPQPAATEKPASPAAVRRQREPALSGYCPAAYLLTGKPAKGDPAFQSTYAGELYYFSSEDAKKQFDADPEHWLPQFNGLCTTALGGTYGNRLPSNPEVFDVVDGKVYLFSSERAKKAYERGPQVYIVNGLTRFNTPALDGYCPVSFQERNRAIKGREDAVYRYRSSVYHFSNEDALRKFIANPEKFLPQFDGYCAEGVYEGKRFTADPEHFSIFGGKIYLFFDAKAQGEFQIDLPEKIKKADENWITLQKEEATRNREMLEVKRGSGD